MTSKVFIFDLDDTLYWNKHDYGYSILEFEKFMMDALDHKAPHVTVMTRMIQETDERMIKEINPVTNQLYGYSMDSFPASLVEVYKEICRKEGIPVDAVIMRQIQEIGITAFSEERYRQSGFVKGAREVLDFLAEKNDYLILVTKGDKGAQEAKIRALKLEHWFINFHIVDTKTRELFRAISESLENTDPQEKLAGKRIYSIGNSYNSDIKPALEAGLKGIYIPYETWETEGEKEKFLRRVKRNRRVVIFDEILDIKRNYGRL